MLSNSQDIIFGTDAFITSFTTKADDLTMWRLYGDDAKGIALNYRIDNNLQNFYLAHVSYADESKSHPELDFLAEVMKITIDNCIFNLKNFYIWRYFFKPYDYRIEDEIRLLYMVNNHSKNNPWIVSGSNIYTPLASFAVVDESNSLEESSMLYPLTLEGIKLGPQFPEVEKNKETISRMFNSRFGWTPKEFMIETSGIYNYKTLENDQEVLFAFSGLAYFSNFIYFQKQYKLNKM